MLMLMLIQNKYQVGHPLACSIMYIVCKTVMVPLHCCLLSRCSAVGTPEASGDIQVEGGGAGGGRGERWDVAPAPVCFGAHASHTYSV